MSDAGESRLDEHRREIEALDAEILRLVRRRISIVESIGRIKSETRTPLRDFDVEEKVKARLRGLCHELGVEERLGDELAVFLIRKAVEVQSPIVDAVYGGDRMRVLVVGGLGGMGRWLSRFLNTQGHRVQVHDTASRESMFPRATTLEAGVADADLVLLAVPMSSCADVMRRVAECAPRGILVEICSLKSHLRETISELREAGHRIVSMHPMFGPETRLLTGKQIVICRDGNEADETVVRGLFEETSARIVELSFDEHDRAMAAVLGMAHLVNLGFAGALSHFGIAFPELLRVASVTFLKQIVTTREVVHENPSLYFDIQRMNPATPAVLDAIAASFAELRAALDDGDFARFAALMNAERAWFDEGEAPGRADLWEATT